VDQRVSFSEQLREFLRRNMTWFFACGLALLLLQDIFGTHGVLAMRRSQKEAAAIQKEINQLNEENRQLQDRVKALKTDPAEIERIAREEMGLARPGEVIFKIPVKPGDPSSAAPGSPGSSRKP
jgi:cell division protein FtsL